MELDAERSNKREETHQHVLVVSSLPGRGPRRQAPSLIVAVIRGGRRQTVHILLSLLTIFFCLVIEIFFLYDSNIFPT